MHKHASEECGNGLFWYNIIDVLRAKVKMSTFSPLPPFYQPHNANYIYQLCSICVCAFSSKCCQWFTCTIRKANIHAITLAICWIEYVLASIGDNNLCSIGTTHFAICPYPLTQSWNKFYPPICGKLQTASLEICF